MMMHVEPAGPHTPSSYTTITHGSVGPGPSGDLVFQSAMRMVVVKNHSHSCVCMYGYRLRFWNDLL